MFEAQKELEQFFVQMQTTTYKLPDPNSKKKSTSKNKLL